LILIWKVKIHRLVLAEDFKSIGQSDQRIILKDIHKKLTISPSEYGKPLLGELKGYWRLRIGDYRVIYKIKQEVVEVLVIKVGIRRDDEVYKKLIPRLKKLQD
jgi:mRNA interferase RelE/StbE